MEREVSGSIIENGDFLIIGFYGFWEFVKSVITYIFFNSLHSYHDLKVVLEKKVESEEEWLCDSQRSLCFFIT